MILPDPQPIEPSQVIISDYTNLRDLLGRAGITVTKRALQSDNFVTGASGAGWQLTAEGNLEATSGTFRGALAATSGTIGGFTIGATTLSATGITLDSSGAIVTAGTLRTASSGSRVNINSSTIQLYDSSGNNDITLGAGAAISLDITHRGAGNCIDIDYAVTGARGFNLIHLQDANQVSGASTDATVLYVDRTSASSSAKNLVDIFNAGGTGIALEVRQNSTAGKAAIRLYQQDDDKTAIYINNDTAATEANIGRLEVVGNPSGMVGIYIVPDANSAHMRLFAGSAPASPVDGDFWYDGTNLLIRVGGTTKTIAFV